MVSKKRQYSYIFTNNMSSSVINLNQERDVKIELQFDLTSDGQYVTHFDTHKRIRTKTAIIQIQCMMDVDELQIHSVKSVFCHTVEVQAQKKKW